MSAMLDRRVIELTNHNRQTSDPAMVWGKECRLPKRLEIEPIYTVVNIKLFLVVIYTVVKIKQFLVVIYTVVKIEPFLVVKVVKMKWSLMRVSRMHSQKLHDFARLRRTVTYPSMDSWISLLRLLNT